MRKSKTHRHNDEMPQPFLFEIAISHWFVAYPPGDKGREYFWSEHRLSPLIADGRIVFDREETTLTGILRYYSATESGARWWAGERLKEYAEAGLPECTLLDAVSGIEFQGIGYQWNDPLCWAHAMPVLAAIRDGNVDLVKYFPGNPSAPRMGESVLLRVTQQGYVAISQIPRLMLECA